MKFYFDKFEITRDSKHGKTHYHVENNEVRDKKNGTVIYYVDGDEIKVKSKHGNVKYYIDGSLTGDQLMGLISII